MKIIKLNVGKKRLKGFLKYFQTLLSYNFILILDCMNEPRENLVFKILQIIFSIKHVSLLTGIGVKLLVLNTLIIQYFKKFFYQKF